MYYRNYNTVEGSGCEFICDKTLTFIDEMCNGSFIWKKFSFFIFFGWLECVGHSFAYVAHFVSLIDVWIRTQRAAVPSRRATSPTTHLPIWEKLFLIWVFLTQFFRISLFIDNDLDRSWRAWETPLWPLWRRGRPAGRGSPPAWGPACTAYRSGLINSKEK